MLKSLLGIARHGFVEIIYICLSIDLITTNVRFLKKVVKHKILFFFLFFFYKMLQLSETNTAAALKPAATGRAIGARTGKTAETTVPATGMR